MKNELERTVAGHIVPGDMVRGHYVVDNFNSSYGSESFLVIAVRPMSPRLGDARMAVLITTYSCDASRLLVTHAGGDLEINRISSAREAKKC